MCGTLKHEMVPELINSVVALAACKVDVEIHGFCILFLQQLGDLHPSFKVRIIHFITFGENNLEPFLHTF